MYIVNLRNVYFVSRKNSLNYFLKLLYVLKIIKKYSLKFLTVYLIKYNFFLFSIFLHYYTVLNKNGFSCCQNRTILKKSLFKTLQ